MSTIKALIYAAVITAVFAAMLTIVYGIPTKERVFDGLTVFIASFIVMKFSD